MLLVAFIAAIGACALLPLLRFDFNPLNLKSPTVESMTTLHDMQHDRNWSLDAINVVVPSLADAAPLARRLVDERLAACVNLHHAMTSIYRWKGQVEEDGERQLVIKTTRERLPALEARLRELHAYELPEFLVLSVSDASDEYRAWLVEQVTSH